MRDRIPVPVRRPGARAAFLAIVMAAVAGCAGSGHGSAGSVRSESLRADAVVLGASYLTVVYAHDPEEDTTFLLTDMAIEDLLAGTVVDGQVLHIDLLWEPKAGATPMDIDATNASVRHVVISGGEVGVYGGAGFVVPRGSPGSDTLTVALRDATVRLLDSTGGFLDPLSPARLTGTFTARHDPELALRISRAISQIVTNALGRTRFVGGALQGQPRERRVLASGLRPR